MTPAHTPTIFNLSRAAGHEGGLGSSSQLQRKQKTSSFHWSARLGGERPSRGGGCSMIKTCGKFPTSSSKPDGGLLATASKATCSQNSTWINQKERRIMCLLLGRAETAAGQGCPPSNLLGYEMHPILNISKSNCNEP